MKARPSGRLESALLAAIHTRTLPGSSESLPAVDVVSGAAALRHGLRAHGGDPRGSAEDGAGTLVRVDPRDGAVCVFRDAPVVAHFSRPLDPAAITEQTFRVWDDRGTVPGHVRLSPDASVLLWEPDAPLAPYVHHFVMSSSLRDTRGREIGTHLSRFLTCDLMRRDISG